MTQPKKEPNGGCEKRPATDIKQLKSLIDLMVDNDLSRLELREGDTRILLRRGTQPVVTYAAAPPAPAPQAAPGAAPAAAAAPQAAENPNETYIRSPMVGTFYLASGPDAPPFVNVGSVVSPDTVVAIVEAMKVFNEIKAELSGRITKVLVKNAAAVEFDQPLFAVEPA